MIQSVLAILFFFMAVVIVFLSFQVQNHQGECREQLKSDQDRLTRVARLLIQSSTQQHPLFALEHILEAKITLSELITYYGSIPALEEKLMKKHQIQSLKIEVDTRYKDVVDFMMTQVVQQRPDLDWKVNELAELQKSPMTKGPDLPKSSKAKKTRPARHSSHTKVGHTQGT